MKGYNIMKEQRNLINKLINKLKRATTEEEKNNAIHIFS